MMGIFDLVQVSGERERERSDIRERAERESRVEVRVSVSFARPRCEHFGFSFARKVKQAKRRDAHSFLLVINRRIY